MKTKILFASLLFSSCTSLDRNLWVPSGSSALGGALGYAFSPNDESRKINALVFGALGGAVGTGLQYLLGKNHPEEIPSTLKERDLRPSGREFTLPATTEKLPAFVKKRLTPIVIEQYEERDSVTEDGALREPHKVWRIKRQPELAPMQK